MDSNKAPLWQKHVNRPLLKRGKSGYETIDHHYREDGNMQS
jgi:hypothetical protein